MIGWLRRLLLPSAQERDLKVDRKLAEAMRIAGGVGVGGTKDVLGLTAAYACIYAISTDLSHLPFKCYQRLLNGGTRLAPEKNANTLLNLSPDGISPACRFRQHWLGHAVSSGNGYAEIRFRADGQPGALHVLDPATRPVIDDSTGRLYYLTPDGAQIAPRRILHIAGFGGDGLIGFSPIELFRRTYDLSVATEEYGRNFFRNGARPGGVIEYPGEISDKARKSLATSFTEQYGGVENSHKVHVLEEGAKYVPIKIPNNEAQFIETKKFGISDMSRIYRVPLHKIADYSQVQLASAGVEALNIDYVQTTLTSWAVQAETECNLKLLSPLERDEGYFFKHTFNAMLRGDMKARSQFYRDLFGIGVLSPNEIRDLEEMNPIDGGDDHYYPLNMSVIGELVNEGDATEDDNPPPDDRV